MANPITWRNVNAPSNSGANQLLTNSTDQMSRGLDTINRVGQGFVDRTRAGEVAESAATSQGFINQISNLDAEQLAVARQDGSFAGNNVAGLSAQDQQRVFAQLKGRDQAIAQEQAATFAQQGAATARQEAPERQEIGNLIASEKYTAARKMLASSGIGDQMDLSRSIDSGQRAFNERAITEGNRVRKIAGGRIVDDAVANNERQRATNAQIISDSRKEIAQSMAGVTLDKDGNFDVSSTEFKGAGAKEELLRQLQARTDDMAAGTKGFGQALTDEQLGDRTRRRLSSAGITGADQTGLLDTVTAGLLRNSSLDDATQNRYASEIAYDNQQADAAFAQEEADHQALVALNPTTPAETRKMESTSMLDVQQLALERAPSDSWLDKWVPFTDNKIGGVTLQDELADLASQTFTKKNEKGKDVTYNVEPWMIKSALMSTTQTSAEAYGNPTTHLANLKKLVELIATDTQGKLRKVKVAESQAKLDRSRLGVTAKKKANASTKLKQYKKDAKIVTGTSAADAIIQRRIQRLNN